MAFRAPFILIPALIFLCSCQTVSTNSASRKTACGIEVDACLTRTERANREEPPKKWEEPPPEWQPAADPKIVEDKVLARVLSGTQKVWARSFAGGCFPLAFDKAQRGSVSYILDGKEAWLSESETTWVDERNWTITESLSAVFDEERSFLALYGRSFISSAPPDGTGEGHGVGGYGSADSKTYQIVEINSDQVKLVRNRTERPFSRYAAEDAAALFFDKSNCENASPPNFSIARPSSTPKLD